jgi:hypothetical protein
MTYRKSRSKYRHMEGWVKWVLIPLATVNGLAFSLAGYISGYVERRFGQWRAAGQPPPLSANGSLRLCYGSLNTCRPGSLLPGDRDRFEARCAFVRRRSSKRCPHPGRFATYPVSGQRYIQLRAIRIY